MGASTDVPALRRGLAVLRLLASHAGPMTAAAVATELRLPRSTVYHLLAELADAGFVTHLPEARRWGLGVAAFEVGSAYLRHDPLEALGRPVLRPLAGRRGRTVHLGVLDGAQTLYLLREQSAWSRGVVTDVGVRLPAALTASGRAMLARLPAAQLRATYPAPAAIVRRTPRGPADLAELRRLLRVELQRGWAVEDGHVSAGFASVATAVADHNGAPVAAISVTFRHTCPGTDGSGGIGGDGTECGRTWPALAEEVRGAATTLSRRIGGRPPSP